MSIKAYRPGILPGCRWPILLVLLLSACATNQPVKPVWQYNDSHAPESKTAPLKPSGPTTNHYRQLVLKNVSAQLGKPYRWGGNSPKTGFDCSGLVFFAHAQAGLKVPRKSKMQLSKAKKVTLNHLQPGDLLFFRTRSSTSHVGIFIGGHKFIHAPSHGKRVSKASLDNYYWHRHLYAAGNFY